MTMDSDHERNLLKDVVDMLLGSPSASFVGYSVRESDQDRYVFRPVLSTKRFRITHGVLGRILNWFAALGSQIHQCRLWVHAHIEQASVDIRCLQASILELLSELEKPLTDVDYALSKPNKHSHSLLGLYRMCKPYEQSMQVCVDLLTSVVVSCNRQRSEGSAPTDVSEINSVTPLSFWSKAFGSFTLVSNAERIVSLHRWLTLPDGAGMTEQPRGKLSFSLTTVGSTAEKHNQLFLQSVYLSLLKQVTVSLSVSCTQHCLGISKADLLQLLVMLTQGNAISWLLLESISSLEDEKVVKRHSGLEPVLLQGMEVLAEMVLPAPTVPIAVPTDLADGGYVFNPLIDEPDHAAKSKAAMQQEVDRWVEGLQEIVSSSSTLMHEGIYSNQTLENIISVLQASSIDPPLPATPSTALRRDFLPLSLLVHQTLSEPIQAHYSALRRKAWDILHKEHHLRQHIAALQQVLWVGDTEVIGSVRDLLAAYPSVKPLYEIAQSMEYHVHQVFPKGLRLVTIAQALQLHQPNSSNSNSSSVGTGTATGTSSGAPSTESLLVDPVMKLSIELHYDWPLNTILSPVLLTSMRAAYHPMVLLLMAHWLAGHWWREMISRATLYLSATNYHLGMSEAMHSVRQVKCQCAAALVMYRQIVSALLAVYAQHVHHKMITAFLVKYTQLEHIGSLALLQHELLLLVRKVERFMLHTAKEMRNMLSMGIKAYDELVQAIKIERSGQAVESVLMGLRLAEIAWTEAVQAAKEVAKKVRRSAVLSKEDKYALTIDELWQLDSVIA